MSLISEYYILNGCVFASQLFHSKNDTEIIYTHDKPINDPRGFSSRQTYLCSFDVEKLKPFMKKYNDMKIVTAKFKEDAVMAYDKDGDVLICDYSMMNQ
jgi:hypothetical protein